MEFSLHRSLKAQFGRPESGGSLEYRHGPYRADALTPDGAWLEVQSGPLGPLRSKLIALLDHQPVRVVKPIVVERRIIRRTQPDGPDLSARRSPRAGHPVEVFDDLVGLARLIPHPHLEIHVISVAIDEIRLPRRRRPGYLVADRILRSLHTRTRLAQPHDLWRLIPGGRRALPNNFTTRELDTLLARGLSFAQRVAYCLRLAGAVTVVGKQGNRLVYRPTPRPSATPSITQPLEPACLTAPSPRQ